MEYNSTFSYGKSIVAAFTGAATAVVATAALTYGLPEISSAFNAIATVGAVVGAGIGRAIYRGRNQEGDSFGSAVSDFINRPMSVSKNIWTGGIPGPQIGALFLSAFAYAAGGPIYDTVKMGQKIHQERKASKKDSFKP